MRLTGKFIVRVSIIVAAFWPLGLWSSVSEASFFGLPRALRFQLGQIGFDAPVLPPIGHSRFCLRYPDDCEVHGIDFRRRNIALTPERWNELNTVNRQVNRDIIAEVNRAAGR
jgi:predicted transglutaminase-like cysteine proteinase